MTCYFENLIEIQMASKNPLRKVGPAKQKIRCIKVCDGKPLDQTETTNRNTSKLIQLLWLDYRTVVVLNRSGVSANFQI